MDITLASGIRGYIVHDYTTPFKDVEVSFVLFVFELLSGLLLTQAGAVEQKLK